MRIKPPDGSVPTYMRFMEGMLKDIDRVVESEGYINASEFVRDAVRLFAKEAWGQASEREHLELADGGIPTYVRLMKVQLDLIDAAVEKRDFQSRSEFARDAVARLLRIREPVTPVG